MNKYLKAPWKIFRPLGDRGLFNWMSDEQYLKILYLTQMGKKLNLESPKTFNEKIQWLKLYYRDSKYTDYVDKYKVRGYIEEKLGQEYLIPLLGVYEKVEDINWNELPNQFVLKCTHGSHCNIICKDKSSLDIEKAKNKLNKWMNKSWYWFGREWPYKDVERKIVCEAFMVDEQFNDLPDYKFMCFNGEPKLILVCRNRTEESSGNYDFYDIDWNLTDIKRPKQPSSIEPIKKPEGFEMMLEFAKKLAEGFPFSRIDFYEVNGKVYFGEITFFPASGLGEFEPEKYDEILGEWIVLP